jgi:hypothetical protein
MNVRELNPRTTCACPVCSVGCRTMPGYLAPLDAERIAQFCGKTEPDEVREFAVTHFQASEGGLLGTQVGDKTIVVQVPTVVPQQRADGSCVFLADSGQCTIHPVSPFGCAFVDSHMSKEEGDRRSLPALQACAYSASYQQLHQFLELEGKVATPVDERKAAMLAELNRINS